MSRTRPKDRPLHSILTSVFRYVIFSFISEIKWCDMMINSVKKKKLNHFCNNSRKTLEPKYLLHFLSWGKKQIHNVFMNNWCSAKTMSRLSLHLGRNQRHHGCMFVLFTVLLTKIKIKLQMFIKMYSLCNMSVLYALNILFCLSKLCIYAESTESMVCIFLFFPICWVFSSSAWGLIKILEATFH